MAVTAGLFTQAWVLFAFASTLLLPIFGMIIDSPRTTLIHQLAMEAQSSTISPELCQRIKDPILGSWNIVGTVLAFWILFLMTTKPDVMGALWSLLVALLLSFSATLPLWKKADVAGSFVVAEDVDQKQTRS
ncbi:hypothetical protein [Ktedonospora formicarum]|uniref:Uncharacterized protein n=1 Tax=Ktedonospora formicarum TaxID=2778364 RepID=A0A8J3IAK4_9CHLR|nr:hypothetical protein [Ktedonospora formicarum]GHO49087.1 hypothetical protein KSX_72500 [Ktedonospora formicarum]